MKVDPSPGLSPEGRGDRGRRNLLRNLLAAGGAGLSGSVLSAQDQSPADLEGLFRAIVRAEPLPGEARVVFQALEYIRKNVDSDPRVQPALGFDPEVDV